MADSAAKTTDQPRELTSDVSLLLGDEAILEQTVSLPVAERAQFLAEVCAGNLARCTRLGALARSHEEAGEFLKLPAVNRPPIVPREQAGDMIGQYRLVERIGEGGGGVVWLADQREPLRRKVALKIIKSGINTRALVARFDTERQALAMMEHPNIARVYDAGVAANGRPYFVMEFVAGVPITKYCDEQRLAIRQRIELFLRVCDAVQHAHQKGILHRDLKPSNILVAPVDGEPAPKIIDFGIAKALQVPGADEQPQVSSELLLGTPVYMSPEAAAGGERAIDTRADIYTLGVLLYEVLTGCVPLDARVLLQGTLEDMRERLRNVMPASPSAKVAALPPDALTARAELRRSTPRNILHQLRGDLDAIVMRCLAKDRNERYESAGALSADLRHHLRDEAVSAVHRSAAYVAGKAIRRHRGVFVAGSLVLFAIVLGGAVSVWQAIRATKAERAESGLRHAETALRLRAEAQELFARRRAYAGDMNLLQQALAQDNLGQAIKLLKRHEPRADEVDLRGWEWRYLWQLCQSEATAELARLLSPVSSLAVSPDGTWVAMGQDDGGTVTLRNLATGETIELRLGNGATRVACSPRAALLAIAYSAGSEPRQTQLRLWDITRREAIAEWELPGAPGSIVFAEDGKTIVTAGGARLAQIDRWHVPTGRRLTTIPPAGWPIIALSRDGQWLAREQLRDGRAWIQTMNTDTGAERWAAEVSEENISSLAFSPDGRYLASAGGNAETGIRIWEAHTGKFLRTLQGHRTYVTALSFTPDGHGLVSASKDQTVRVWDHATGELRRTFRGHQLEVHSLALMPDGQSFVTGAKDGVVLRWNASAPSRQTYTRINDAVVGWAFTPEEDGIVTVDANGRVALRSGPGFSSTTSLFDTGPIAPWAQQTSGPVVGAFFARHAPLFAVPDDNGNTKVFDWKQRRLVTTLPTNAERIQFGRWDDDSRTLTIGHAVSSSNAKLHEWDLATGRVVRSWAIKEPNLQQFVFSADGRFSVVRAGSGIVSVLDIVRHAEQTLSERAPLVNSIAVSPDKMFIAAASGTGWARVWRRDDAQLAAELSGFVLGVHSAAFTPRGERLITGSGDQEALRLWDVNTWEPVLTLPSQGSRYGAVTISSNERFIGSRSFYGRLHIWRAPTMAEIMRAKSAAH